MLRPESMFIGYGVINLPHTSEEVTAALRKCFPTSKDVSPPHKCAHRVKLTEGKCQWAARKTIRCI